MLFFPLQWNFLVYACFILKNTFICLGEEIILQTIFSKVKKKKKKESSRSLEKFTRFFSKERPNARKAHNANTVK